MRLEVKPNNLDPAHSFSQTFVFSYTQEEIITCLSARDLIAIEEANKSESIAGKMKALALIASRIEAKKSAKTK